jgi:excisionase family DNA binding protein
VSAIPDRRLFSKSEARARLGDISTTTLNKMIREGTIEAVYIGGRTLIPDAEIDRVVANASTVRTHRRGGSVTRSANS